VGYANAVADTDHEELQRTRFVAFIERSLDRMFVAHLLQSPKVLCDLPGREYVEIPLSAREASEVVRDQGRLSVGVEIEHLAKLTEMIGWELDAASGEECNGSGKRIL
jgi:hypothetical protein